MLPLLAVLGHQVGEDGAGGLVGERLLYALS